MAVQGPATVSPAPTSTASPAAKAPGPTPPAVTVPTRVALIRCPRCGKAFERTGHVLQVCPNCGLRAPTTEPGERVMPEGVLGRPRRAWVAALLTFLVTPVFWPIYLLRTFRPLDKQHGRNHPIGLWVPAVVPLLGVLLAVPYGCVGLYRLGRSRRARGLRPGVGPLTFALLAGLSTLAAAGYGAWLVGTQPDSTGAFDFDPDHFDAARLSDGDAYTAVFVTAPDPLAQLLFGALTSLVPAIAVALVVASANKLWKEIYAERGEAWPWRTGMPDATEPAAGP